MLLLLHVPMQAQVKKQEIKKKHRNIENRLLYSPSIGVHLATQETKRRQRIRKRDLQDREKKELYWVWWAMPIGGLLVVYLLIKKKREVISFGRKSKNQEFQEPPRKRKKEQEEKAIKKDKELRYEKVEDFYEKELKKYEKVLETQRKTIGFEHLDYAQTLQSIANLHYHYDKRQTGQAYVHYMLALQVLEKNLGKNHLKCAETLHNLGNIFYRENYIGYRKDRHHRAMEFYKRALKIREEKLGKNDLKCAEILHNLGDCLLHINYTVHNEDQHRRAMEFYKRALKIREEKLGENDLKCAETLQSIGKLLQAHGNFSHEAIEYYRRALKIREEKLGENDLKIAETFLNIGEAYEYHNDDEDYEYLSQLFGEGDNPEKLDFYEAMRDEYTFEALQFYQGALERKEKKLGKDHLECAEILKRMGVVYYNIEEYIESLKIFKRAQEIRKKNLGRPRTPSYIVNDIARTNRTISMLERKIEEKYPPPHFVDELYLFR